MQLTDALKLQVGDLVCDCRFLHLHIRSLSTNTKGDVDVVLEDGANMSAVHCLDLTSDHTIEDHPVLTDEPTTV